MINEQTVADVALGSTTIVVIITESLDFLGLVLGVMLVAIRVAISLREWQRGSKRTHTRKDD